MDDGEKLTLAKMLNLFRRLLNELHVGSVPSMAFINLISETVETYHLYFGVDTRTLVQKVVYAMVDLPGDPRTLYNIRSDIVGRLEREHRKVAGRMTTLQYMLPLDDEHMYENPPFRRIQEARKVDKTTQTAGLFQLSPSNVEFFPSV